MYKCKLKRLSCLVLCAGILTGLSLFLFPIAHADLDYLVTLDPSKGPPGTKVVFSINIQQYFYEKYPPPDDYDRTNDWEDYVNRRFYLLWNCDTSEEYQPQYWNVIGEATVDYTGLLWGEATIPDAVAGHHDISAVYEYNDQYYMDSWTKEFIVTEGGDTPGFEFVFVVCAAAVLLLFWEGKQR
jgi:hypothetical protein